MRKVVLGYHDVVAGAARDTTGFVGPGPNRYKIDPLAFAGQLEAIEAAAGRTGLAFDETARVVLTFDDGGRSSLETIAPLLDARDWHGHFFVATGRIGTAGFLDEAGIRELAASGHDIGSHSHTHPFLTRLDDRAVDGEWRRSKDILEQILGRAVVSASIPTGYYEERIGRSAEAAGYTLLFTSEPRTETRRLGELVVRGRFAVTTETPTARVGDLAAHSGRALAREALWWHGRNVAKRTLGPVYQHMRQSLLARRS